jgi:flagellar protein FlaI
MVKLEDILRQLKTQPSSALPETGISDRSAALENNDKIASNASVSINSEPSITETFREQGSRRLDVSSKFSLIDEIVEKERMIENKPFRERSKVLLMEYDDVAIYDVEGEEVPVYIIKTIKPLSASEQRIYNEAREVAVRNIELKRKDFTNRERLEEIKTKIREIVTKVAKKYYISEDSPVIDRLTELVFNDIAGFGILNYLLKDDNLEEIMVIGTNKPVYVFHRKIGMCKTNIVFHNDEEIVNIIRRIAYFVDRRIDQQVPLLDARLPDGSRVNATIPPVSLDGPTLTIRKFRKDPLTVLDLIKFKTMTPELAAFLWLAVDGLFVKPANIIIAGGTGSGKTTTLNVLATFIPPWERVITIEDTAELQLPIKHWVREETRPPSIEGTGEITMDDLVKNALRQRPDRIIVGEIRGPEARTLFVALNTGHDGGMGTVHANSSRETVIRLKSPPMNVPTIMLNALNFIIMQHRLLYRGKHVRRIVEIAELTGMEGDQPRLNIVYSWDAKTDVIKRTEVPIHYLEILSNYSGLTLKQILDEIEERKEFLLHLLEKQESSGKRFDVHEIGKYVQAYIKLKKKELNR